MSSWPVARGVRRTAGDVILFRGTRAYVSRLQHTSTQWWTVLVPKPLVKYNNMETGSNLGRMWDVLAINFGEHHISGTAEAIVVKFCTQICVKSQHTGDK